MNESPPPTKTELRNLISTVSGYSNIISYEGTITIRHDLVNQTAVQVRKDNATATVEGNYLKLN